MTPGAAAETKPSADRGVFYVVTGERFCRAAVRAAKSVRQHSPTVGIHIFCDPAGVGLVERESERVGLEITLGLIENAHYRSKVDYIWRSPFDYSLYLDADTRACAPLDDVFTLLDRFDVALAHVPRRNHPKTRKSWNLDLPDAFPQFNSGVIAFRKNRKVLEFFQQWQRCFHAEVFTKDQITLRELLWKSDLRIATLPPEYNIRLRKYLYVWGKKEAKPRILHFRSFVEPSSGQRRRRLFRSLRALRRRSSSG